ncbi:MAG: discoidin domain-containing protein [Burkholderiales bacterium]
MNRIHPLTVLGLFVGLTLAWTWPLPTQIASRVAFDPGDPFLNAWILWWNAQELPFTEPWWNPPIFYPMRGALTLSEHLAGVAFFTTPLIRLGGSPALAYNVALLLSCTLSGFFCYLLVRRLTGSAPAAICAGLAYAFAPVRAGQLSHLQVLCSQWLPLLLLGLHGYVESGRRRWLVLFGGSWILQSLSNGYYLLFAPVLIGGWVCWFVLAARRWRRAGWIFAAWVLASVPLLPMLLKYREIHGALGLRRPLKEILLFSGDALSFLKPPPMLAVWPDPDVGALEDFLFPGLTIVLVVGAACVHAARSRTPGSAHAPLASAFLFYVFGALLMAALTLGPAAPDDGILGWLKPYQWLSLLPGFDGVRVPVRFAMLMALCLAVAGGIGLAAMMPAGRVARSMLVTCVAAGLLLDGAIKPLTGSAPPGRVEMPEVPSAAVLELPPDNRSVSRGAMFRSISHGLPLINGYSGYIPRHYDILGQSLRRGDPSGVIELARGRTLLLLVAERNDRGGHFRRLIESIPGVQQGDVTGAGMSYVLPAQPSDRRPRGGTAHAFTASEQPREHVVLDLGTPRVIRSLEFPLRNHYPAFGERFAIDVSDDGMNWKREWNDWTAGVAVAGALEDQVVVPIRLALPDLTARYLRIHPAPDWLMQELRVLGP